LTACHFAHYLVLDFLADFMFDIFFLSPEHKRLEYFMQALDLMLIQLPLVLRMCLNILRKPLLELLMRVKQLRHNEMQQSPQFSHRILYRCSSQQQPIPRMKPHQYLPSLRSRVLYSLGLIEDHVLPFETVEGFLIGHD
jgi:hypothetical protein